MANSKTQNLWPYTLGLTLAFAVSIVAFLYLVFELVSSTPDVTRLCRRLDWVPLIGTLPSPWPALVPIFVAFFFMNVSMRLLVWHLNLGNKTASPPPLKQFKDECPSGGRHQPYLAQEDGGNGQIHYRSRCKKCRNIIGFGFEQIGHR